MILIAIVGILAFIIFASREAPAEEIDPRVPTFTTGVTVGPWIGGNSWPHTGTGIAIPFQHRSDDGTVGKFMDWRTLQAHRAHAAAAAALQSIHFDFDSAALDPLHTNIIDYVAQILLDNPEVSLTLQGHTDLVGPDEYNEALAERRAAVVWDALIERGVPADRFDVVAGFGESVPLELILGPSLLNRRVEVVPTLDLP
jgi:outer membrane protein OmpA-like peptidoglycan-associated protein